MRKISAVLITFNEEEKIGRALDSLSGVSDEIVVVDSGSQDATVEICRRVTQRVQHRDWSGYREQKQYATDQASYDWVLSLDADEALSPELQEEILRWKSRQSVPADGYFLPRMTFFMGTWIRHTGWYPDWQLRLFRKSSGHWRGGRVHETVSVEGSTERLSGHLYHYTYSSVSEYLQQLERFSGLAAADYLEKGKKVRAWQLALHPAFEFFRNFVIYRGFQDGLPGFVVSTLSATSVFFKYLKLWELQKTPADPDE